MATVQRAVWFQDSRTQLDAVLMELCEEVQLSPARYQLAVQRYGSVNELLEKPGSPFHPFHPRIFPQGSMALGTTSKPVEGPHDLDFVLQLDAPYWQWHPMAAFHALYNFLHDNETYRKMLSRKNRVVRLTYADEFYMDILPAYTDANAACLGLRASEIAGLQWGDFNWEDLTLLVKRSVVHGRVADTKTEASQLPLPIDPRLARILREHLKRSLHRRPQDWVFGNRHGRPRWQESILHRQLRPAALRAGLGKIGWHTFRHSYSNQLRSLQVDLKVQQELLRHSTIQSTMNIYTRAMPKKKRAANRLVVGRLLRAQSRKWKSRSLGLAK